MTWRPTILTALAAALTVGTALPIIAIRKVGRHVTAARPFRHLIALLRGELAAPRPDDSTPTIEIDPTGTDLSAESPATHQITTNHLKDSSDA